MLFLLSRIGRTTLDQLSELGKMFIFLFTGLFLEFRPPVKASLIIQHIKSVGVDSVAIVLLSGFFTGMVMGFQGYYSLRQFNAESWLGSAVALTLLRELGPVLSAFMVTGRTGSAMAAELGSMRATEQIDAFYSMAIDPIKYLVSPRLIAGLIVMPLLGAIFDVVGIYGAYVVGVKLLGVSSGSYFSGMVNSVVFHDVYTGMIKSSNFGIIITWVCCYKGFHAPPMATGVGQATTQSVVLSFVLILVWDYFLTSIMF
ncbi:MAG: MlaE family ABC transporter permease [Candidatus Binatia bacterium]